MTHPRLPLVLLLLLLTAVITRPAMAQQEEPQPPPVRVHVVAPAETVEDIAAAYGVTVTAIMRVNNIPRPDDIATGQRLVIPSISLPLAERGQVLVDMSVTLTEIAVGVGLPAEQIGRANNLVNPRQLYVGQLLEVPAGADLARLDDPTSLWGAALRTNRNPYALMLDNGMASPHAVTPGQLIRVAGAEQPVSMLPEPWAAIDLRPFGLEQGRSGGLSVTTALPGTLSGTFLGRELVFRTEDGTTHAALIGVGRDTPTGVYPMSITLTTEGGETFTYERAVNVGLGRYFTERIIVPADVAVLLEDTETEAAEQAYIRAIMTRYTEPKRWDGLFILPTPGVLTSQFGVTRDYNDGALSRFHAGTDFGARVGTPIYAPADGVVVDIATLDVRGLVTFIDHGVGVVTGYWHQAAILVEPGQEVVQGEQIGTVGNTGLSNAAHLHWEMWVDGVPVDPMQWVRQPFP